MARALPAIQCHPRLLPRLAHLRRVSNMKHPSMNSFPSYASKPNPTIVPSSYPCPFPTNCNSLTRLLRPPFPLPHGNISSNLTVTNSDDPQAIDVVFKLYSAMRNRNPQAISDLLADDCKGNCYFTPSFHGLEGKERVMEFLNALLGFMGEHMEFEIETSCYGKGDSVGILWHLEWKGNCVPYGKGCTIFSCEKREGKVLIRNMDMFMESAVKLGLLQLWLMGMLMLMLSKCINITLNWIGMKSSI